MGWSPSGSPSSGWPSRPRSPPRRPPTTAFSLSWWSFTFPVGTLLTGTSALAKATSLDVMAWTAAGPCLVLLVAWMTVFTRITHGALKGQLLRPPVAQLNNSQQCAWLCAQPRRSRRGKMTKPTVEITIAQPARTAASPPSIPWTRAMLALYGYQKLSLANHASDAFMGRNTAST